MNAPFALTRLPWLNKLLASQPTIQPQPRCKCGRFTTHDHKPDATARLVSDMTKAGLYVPAKARAMVERLGAGE